MRLMSRPSNRISPAGRPLEPQDAAAGRGLAAAALADQPQRLAAVDREVDAVDRLHVADLAAAARSPRRSGSAWRGRAPRGAACRARLVVHAATSCAAPGARRCGSRRRDGPPRRPARAPAARGRSARRRSGSAGGRRSRRRAASGRAAGRRPDRAAPAAAGRAAAPSAAAPSCRDGAGRGRSRRRCPLSTMRPAYMTFTRVGVAGDHAEIVGDDDLRDVELGASATSSARGSAPGW